MLDTRNSSRDVPAVPMKVKLLATHETGAPIHAMASMVAGTFHSVEGEVSFVPKAQGQYVVMGVLSKDRSAVWIQDLETNQPATDMVVLANGVTTVEAATHVGHPFPAPPRPNVVCDKWGNPKNDDGTSCQ